MFCRDLSNTFNNVFTSSFAFAGKLMKIKIINRGKNDHENTIKNFAISAISDVLNGARENLSLKILAKLIFESGDIDRASNW